MLELDAVARLATSAADPLQVALMRSLPAQALKYTVWPRARASMVAQGVPVWAHSGRLVVVAIRPRAWRRETSGWFIVRGSKVAWQ
jgi:hypothetical protein